MGKHTIYLRSALFTLPGESGHVPVGATILEGELVDSGSGGVVTIRCERFLDERGRELSERKLTLLVPWSKIDHVHVKS